MKTYLRENNSKNLIVFLCGWALDEKPFNAIESANFDVLFIFNYSDLNLDFDFSKYDKKALIAFSYGVFIASVIKDKLPVFDYKVAVNGTLKPIDKDFGINEKIFDLTLNSVNKESMHKFYSRMFDNNLDDEYFRENLPNRTPENAKEELSQIKQYFKTAKDSVFEYDKAVVSLSDKIFPAKSQTNYWPESQIKTIEAGHFLFYKFNDFNEIINL